MRKVFLLVLLLIPCIAAAQSSAAQGGLRTGAHTVSTGDTLSAIAYRLGIRVSDISGYKSGNPDLIYPDEVLTTRTAEVPAKEVPAIISQQEVAEQPKKESVADEALLRELAQLRRENDELRQSWPEKVFGGMTTVVRNFSKSVADNKWWTIAFGLLIGGTLGWGISRFKYRRTIKHLYDAREEIKGRNEKLQTQLSSAHTKISELEGELRESLPKRPLIVFNGQEITYELEEKSYRCPCGATGLKYDNLTSHPKRCARINRKPDQKPEIETVVRMAN